MIAVGGEEVVDGEEVFGSEEVFDGEEVVGSEEVGGDEVVDDDSSGARVEDDGDCDKDWLELVDVENISWMDDGFTGAKFPGDEPFGKLHRK